MVVQLYKPRYRIAQTVCTVYETMVVPFYKPRTESPRHFQCLYVLVLKQFYWDRIHVAYVYDIHFIHHKNGAWKGTIQWFLVHWQSGLLTDFEILLMFPQRKVLLTRDNSFSVLPTLCKHNFIFSSMDFPIFLSVAKQTPFLHPVHCQVAFCCSLDDLWYILSSLGGHGGGGVAPTSYIFWWLLGELLWRNIVKCLMVQLRLIYCYCDRDSGLCHPTNKEFTCPLIVFTFPQTNSTSHWAIFCKYSKLWNDFHKESNSTQPFWEELSFDIRILLSIYNDACIWNLLLFITEKHSTVWTDHCLVTQRTLG